MFLKSFWLSGKEVIGKRRIQAQEKEENLRPLDQPPGSTSWIRPCTDSWIRFLDSRPQSDPWIRPLDHFPRSAS